MRLATDCIIILLPWAEGGGLRRGAAYRRSLPVSSAEAALRHMARPADPVTAEPQRGMRGTVGGLW